RGLRARQITGIHEGSDIGRQVPSVSEHRKALVRWAPWQRKTAERVRAHLHSGFIPGTTRSEGYQLHSGLIDVALEIIGNYPRPRKHHVDIERGRIRGAAKIV